MDERLAQALDNLEAALKVVQASIAHIRELDKPGPTVEEFAGYDQAERMRHARASTFLDFLDDQM